MRKVLIGICIFIVFVIIIASASMFVFSNFFESIVDNRIIKSIDSPDGRYTAVAFIRDGGATTDYSPQVSVLKKGRELGNKTGNVFIGNHSDYIDVKWEDSKTLVINHNVNERDIYKEKVEVCGIKIKYNVK